jgi:hypothetical protein
MQAMGKRSAIGFYGKFRHSSSCENGRGNTDAPITSHQYIDFQPMVFAVN